MKRLDLSLDEQEEVEEYLEDIIPDEQYTNIVETLQNNVEFMEYFNDLREKMSEGIDFLEKLDVTYVGKDNKIKQVVKGLSTKRDNIVMLVGDAGEGKTTLTKKLMASVNDRELGLNIGYYFVIIKVNILKMKALGDNALLKEMENVLEHMKGLEDKAIQATGLKSLRIIAFFDEAHKLISAFGNDSKLGGDALKEGFTPSKVGAIACTTRQEYMETIAKDVPLKQRFEVVQMDKLTPNEVLVICRKYWEDLLEKPPYYKHGKLEDSELERLIELAGIFFTDEAEPRRSTRLIKMLEAHCRTERINPDRSAIDDIFRYRDVEPNIQAPIESIKKALDNIKGQEMVKDQIMDWAYMVRAKSADRGKLPILVIFCYGPSGVGKTELIKQLSMAIYGRADDSTILDVSIPRYADRVDGGELMLRHIGHGIENRRSCIINVAEFEKGVPSPKNKYLKTNVMPLFLDMLDEGVCEYDDINGNGKIQTYYPSLRNNIVVFTSNAGFENQEVQDKLGEAFDFQSVTRGKMKDRRARIESSARERLNNNNGVSPEFLNRCHVLGTFTGLGEYVGVIIAENLIDLELGKFEEEQGIKVIREPKKMVKPDRIEGTTKTFKATELAVFVGRTKSNMKSSRSGGARQIKRVVEKEILSYVGRAISEYEIEHHRTPEKIRISVANGGFDDSKTTKEEMEVEVECIG